MTLGNFLCRCSGAECVSIEGHCVEVPFDTFKSSDWYHANCLRKVVRWFVICVGDYPVELYITLAKGGDENA